MTAPHLLLLAIGFPPAAKSSTLRLREAANQFASLGWRVSVLNADANLWRHDSGLDESLLVGLHPNVRRIELPLRRPDLETDIRTYSRARAENPSGWARQLARRTQKDFPEPFFGAWRTPLIKAAERVHADRPVDLVLASCTPYVLLDVARHLADLHGIPYAVDFRDGWSIDVVTGEVAFAKDTRAGIIEEAALTGAEALWVVNDPIAEHYRQRYPEIADRVHVVRNGFDEQSRPPARTSSSTPLRFGYLGKVSFKAPVMQLVVDAWRRARAIEPRLRGARLEVCGHISAGATRESTAVSRVLDEAYDDGVRFGGPVPKAEVAATYARWDATVLILIGGRFVTSGKVYEYAASGLPVVAVHEREHDASVVMEGYPLRAGEPSLGMSDIVEQLCRAARMAIEATPEQRSTARAFAEHLARPRQMAPAVAELDAATRMRARA